MKVDNEIAIIEAEISDAKAHLLEIEAAMGLLQQAGMFENGVLPNFQWQARNGSAEKKYLYLMFHTAGDGVYTGPDGKRKVYLGCDEAKIADVRRLESNTKLWRGIRDKSIELRAWINSRLHDLEIINERVVYLLEKSRSWPSSYIPSPKFGTNQNNQVKISPIGDEVLAPAALAGK